MQDCDTYHYPGKSLLYMLSSHRQNLHFLNQAHANHGVRMSGFLKLLSCVCVSVCVVRAGRSLRALQ